MVLQYSGYPMHKPAIIALSGIAVLIANVGE